jgi:hypothetical protein
MLRRLTAGAALLFLAGSAAHPVLGHPVGDGAGGTDPGIAGAAGSQAIGGGMLLGQVGGSVASVAVF